MSLWSEWKAACSSTPTTSGSGSGGSRTADHTRAVVLDAETVPFVDVTAAQMLDQLSAELDRAGVALLLARDIGQVRDLLRQAHTDKVVQPVYRSVDAAVAAARDETGRLRPACRPVRAPGRFPDSITYSG